MAMDSKIPLNPFVVVVVVRPLSTQDHPRTTTVPTTVQTIEYTLEGTYLWASKPRHRLTLMTLMHPYLEQQTPCPRLMTT
jgi:hypothetical protein